MVIGATVNANTTANTQTTASEHITLADTHVTVEHSLERSKPTPVRPEHAGKNNGKRPTVFYDDRGFRDSSDLVDKHIHGANGGRVTYIRQFPPPSLDQVDPVFQCTFIN